MNNKIVTVNYANLDFTVDFTKRGIPEVSCLGKTLKPIFNRKLSRYHYSIYLTNEQAEKVPGSSRLANGYGAMLHVYRYRIISAALEVLHGKPFNYEEFSKMQTDHIDNDPTNDNPSNLRIVTRQQNNSRKHARLMRHLNYTNTKHDNEMVKATNIETGEERLFKNVMQCSKALGFSHVLGYRVINRTDYAKTARGWQLEYVSLTYGILPMDNMEV